MVIALNVDHVYDALKEMFGLGPDLPSVDILRFLIFTTCICRALKTHYYRMDRNALARESRELRAEIDSALEEEDDPLAAYDQFVKWTMKNYTEGDPSSGLLELLEEATRKFKDDISYKGDLRYLKLWCQYAHHVDRPVDIYDFLVANDIGNGYALLYEEYAKALEVDGRHKDADDIFRQGIKRNARPLERLRKRYKEFQARPSSSSRTTTTASRPKETSGSDIHNDPLKNHKLSQSSSSRQSKSPPLLNNDPYLHMHAPTAPGRRPEKLRFNLALLYTEEGGEYSVQESRARSMGLLGKKWGPPPASELPPSSVRVNFNEDNQKTVKGPPRKSFSMRGEPTVTINTKEALADVFGMYNSPEKTMKLERPGSKHAPLKKVEPVTPGTIAPALMVRPPSKELGGTNENAGPPAVKTPAFKPFVDENAGRKENATPTPKFKPFVDSETSNKIPFVTPDVSRRALSAKDPSAPTPTFVPRPKLSDKGIRGELQTVPEDAVNTDMYSKVFTPKGSQKDVFSDDSRESSPVDADVISVFQAPTAAPVATFVQPPDANVKTPFKVFSRPPDQSENAFTPKAAVFTPFVDAKPIDRVHEVPRAVLGERTPSRSPEAEVVTEEEELNYSREGAAVEDDIPESHTPDTEEQSVYEQEVGAYRVPLGGRFGQFNVMTPITERTFDFTMSTRGLSTPRDNNAVESAERLAAELREEDEHEEPLELVREEEFDSSFASSEEESARPFRVSDGHTIPIDPMMALEEKTGTLSLIDALTMASSFKPANPCNPFDPPIVSILLSLIHVNSGFHDLRDQEAKLLEPLQKFAHKQIRQSGNTSSRSIASDMCYSLELAGRRFNVSNKLGEGGFGAVFAAKVKDVDDSFIDDEDEDDEGEDASMIAIKVVKPRNLWEFHILRRVHHALPVHLRRSVVVPHALYAYRDESFLILDLCPQGTLLDIVNRASQAGVSQQGACLDELLVMFFAIELLRVIEGMHSAGFIHGDLKIDNCLLRLEDVPGGAASLSSIYSPTGEQGWSHKGIKLIDFGRTIETGLFPVGQKFIADWPVDAKDCPEMREERPWTYQADYYGLAGIIYCLLFGKYIEASSVVTSSDSDPRVRISTPFKRYWQSSIWSNLFDLLLNSGSVRTDGNLPLCDELAIARQEMETWLKANCNRSSGTLKGLLKKIELSVYSR